MTVFAHAHTLLYSKDVYEIMDGLGERIDFAAYITPWMHVHQLDDQ